MHFPSIRILCLHCRCTFVFLSWILSFVHLIDNIKKSIKMVYHSSTPEMFRVTYEDFETRTQRCIDNKGSFHVSKHTSIQIFTLNYFLHYRLLAWTSNIFLWRMTSRIEWCIKKYMFLFKKPQLTFIWPIKIHL